MRIVSLVPHATELLYALGLGDSVVGVTHECDFPAQTAGVARVTRDLLPAGLSAGEIDAAVRERTEQGQAIYALDEALLAELQPDLIVTQALCPVCAVSYDDVTAVAQRLEPRPKVIALDPKTFGETMGDIRTVALATDAEEEGVDLVARLRARVDRIKTAVEDAPARTLVALEWFDPVFVAGHWTPQVIELAGGVDLLGFPGEHSEQVDWDAVRAARPDVLLCIPCGYDGPRALEEAARFAGELRSTGAKELVALDAAAYFSRPGPRLVDGLETLAHALHPGRVRDAPGEVHRLAL
ncbi:MAG: iron complex transport system substrate-binding protein [Baekduia sp.]|jgi:iron complex transport system substrate-binding protein|nr:iron complex transport system substrate-binding protein [Baekduia sp.]